MHLIKHGSRFVRLSLISRLLLVLELSLLFLENLSNA